MELSGRIFGFSSWSMLLPEALAGLATVMVLYHLVRRWFGEPAAVLASLALALTPVAVVIFRYNDPDAFLTLLLVLAAWALWRAIETGKTIGLVLSGALVGLAFLTKTLDAFIVVPALGVAYLWCGPPRLARRLGQLGWAALALLVSSGWWVAIVELWPKSARPYIGGSTDNSELNLIFGYNGFSRIFGSGGGAGRRGGATAGGSSAFGGGEGLLRMFDSELGGQISWLLPVALVGLVAGLWLTRRHPRADRRRAGFVLWGGSLLMYLTVYDDAKGIFHPYYTVVMAPAVAALAGAGAVALWRLGRQSLRWAWVLPAAVVGTALWADTLLRRTSGYDSWVGPTIVVTGVVSALGLFLCLARPRLPQWSPLAAGSRGRRVSAGRSGRLLVDHARHDDERHRHCGAHLRCGGPRCRGRARCRRRARCSRCRGREGRRTDWHADRRASGWRDRDGTGARPQRRAPEGTPRDPAEAAVRRPPTRRWCATSSGTRAPPSTWWR